MRLLPLLLLLSPFISAAEFHLEERAKSYFHSNLAVENEAASFIADLQKSYEKGEGMIAADVERVLKGITFAAEKHQYQTRKDPEHTPYIIHPIGVAHHLLTVGGVRDPDILIGALLHDTVEDTNCSFEEIEASFGKRVAGFVKEVTDDKRLSKAEIREQQVLTAPKKSAGAAQIKLGDIYYNLNDTPPSSWSKSYRDGYFKTKEKVANALPWVNAQLKEAVDETIKKYWGQG